MPTLNKIKQLNRRRYSKLQLIVFAVLFGILGSFVWNAFATEEMSTSTATVPAAPQLTEALSSQLKTVVLSWNAPTSDGGSAITGYVATASPGGATCQSVAILGCTIKGLSFDVSYSFTVKAMNDVGLSPSSNSLSVTPTDVTLPVGLPYLDDGYCYQAFGQEVNSATPSFVIRGNGGLASYEVYIDGTLIGTFNTKFLLYVCVKTTVPLSEGPHRLTGRELSPNPANKLIPLDFIVDTIPPQAPSAPFLVNDTGVKNDNITRSRDLTLSGTAEPGITVRIVENGITRGNTISSSNGTWSAAAGTKADGDHMLSAIAIDKASNESLPGPALVVKVDSVAPTGSILSPQNNSTVSGITEVSASASDDFGIWKVDFLVVGVISSTVTSAPYAFSWDTRTAALGSHVLQTVITDIAGNTFSTPSTYITVTTSTQTRKPGDANGDNLVNITDLSILLSNWNTTNASCDFNSDGVVNITDLSILLSNWGM